MQKRSYGPISEFARNIRTAFLCSLITLQTLALKAQSNESPFRSPVDFPIELAGSFAELRSGHFHSGMDIKTGGRVGADVHSVADGYVSRIKISPYGFGKAIYIDHPNGYTSVYAHLQSLSEPMAGYVREMQYRKKSFALDLYFTPHQFDVKKGDVIAKSGNSGGSSGPHLHFELRKSAGQLPVNPVTHGIHINDNLAPQAIGLYLYGEAPQPRYVPLSQSGNRYLPKGKTTRVSVPEGRVALGIRVLDRMNGNSGRLGLYQSELIVNGETRFEWTAETFSFSETRYANAHMDYALKKRKGILAERLFKLPGDQLSMYSDLKEDGWIKIKKGQTLPVKIILRDAMGNESTVECELYGEIRSEAAVLHPKGILMLPGQTAYFERDNIRLIFPARALYDTINFHLETDPKIRTSDQIGPRYFIHSAETPLHQRLTINIKTEDFPSSWKSKAVLVRAEGKEKEYYTGKWSGDIFIVRSRDFGEYYLSMDTIAPLIEWVDKEKEWSAGESIGIHIEDSQSGISSYDAFLNGQWFLMEYDYKKKKLIGTLPASIKENSTLRILIADKAGNKSEKKFQLAIKN